MLEISCGAQSTIQIKKFLNSVGKCIFIGDYMNNVTTKLKGIVFIIAGVLWLAGIFIKSWPTISLRHEEVFLFLLATISGFGVMTQGVAWVNLED